MMSLFFSPMTLFRSVIGLAEGTGLASLRLIFFITTWVLVLRWSRCVKTCSLQVLNVRCGTVAVSLSDHLFYSSMWGSKLWEMPSCANLCACTGTVSLPKSPRAKDCTHEISVGAEILPGKSPGTRSSMSLGSGAAEIYRILIQFSQHQALALFRVGAT